MEYFKITDGPGKKTSGLLNECRKQFKVWSYFDDKELDRQFPAPKKETVRYFKKTIEPDSEYLGKSAQDMEGVDCITFRERVIMELQYFIETKGHLDVSGWTICSGSRYSYGLVPRLCWLPTLREVRAGWRGVGSRGSAHGPRVAVPNPLNSSSSTLESRVAELEAWKDRLEKAVGNKK